MHQSKSEIGYSRDELTEVPQFSALVVWQMWQESISTPKGEVQQAKAALSEN